MADFKKKHGVLPSHFAAQAYETIMLINSGVVAVNGDLSKMDAMRTALEKADFEAVRGNFKYGKNHYPIQDFYGRKVVKGADGNWTIVSTGKVVSDSAAYNASECKR